MTTATTTEYRPGQRVRYARKPFPSRAYTGTIQQVTHGGAWLIVIPDHRPNGRHYVPTTDPNDVELETLPDHQANPGAVSTIAIDAAHELHSASRTLEAIHGKTPADAQRIEQLKTKIISALHHVDTLAELSAIDIDRALTLATAGEGTPEEF